MVLQLEQSGGWSVRASAFSGPILEHEAFWIRLSDMAVILAFGLVAYLIRMRSLDMDGPYLAVILLGLGVQQLSAAWFRLYRAPAPLVPQAVFAGLLSSLIVTFLILAGIGYLAKVSETFSRLWVAYWLVGSLIAMVVVRVVILRVARKAAGNSRRGGLLLIGDSDRTAWIARRMQADQAVIRAIVTPDQLIACPDFLTGVDDILLVGPLGRSATLNAMALLLRSTPARVRYLLEEPLLDLRPPRSELVGGLPAIDLLQAPLNHGEAFIKRLLDIVLSSLIFLISLPVLIIAALCIKLETPGPILFKQQRTGFGGGAFMVYKFRTMHVSFGDVCGGPQAIPGDRRVTRVGQFLRRTSIDELPQLLNVLAGDMSLVGPRPHAVSHDADFASSVGFYAARRRMKPGLTGWAQVNGLRGPFDENNTLERRVALDLEYIENWSIAFDLWIIALTPFQLLTGRNAV